MKSNLLVILTFFGKSISAQSFIEAFPAPPFEGVESSSIAFADVDGDNDLDVLITGRNNSSVPISKLYTNDGGNFTEVMGTPFEGVFWGSIAFADVDGDNDLDVLITGRNNSSVPISKLYTNDGGNFTEVLGTPFEGVYNSSIAFADVDGDNDLDVLILGRNIPLGSISRLYANDGGYFTEVLGTPFVGVNDGMIAFSDVDGDNDQDVLISGENNFGARISKLYTNDGGNFTEVLGTPFEGVDLCFIAFSDVDGDSDQDVLITGVNNLSGPGISKLYTNDGGNFTEVLGTPFEDVFHGSIAFADVDGDNDQDVLISGENNFGARISKLYTNEGGNFTEVMNTPFEGVDLSSIAFADVDGDNDQDVLITGWNGSARVSKLYTNESLVSTVENETEVLSFAFTIFPNPTGAEDKINVSYSSTENSSLTVNIFDLDGHLLSQQPKQLGIGEQTFSIDITSLNKGSYFIQVEDGKRKGVRKFMVL